MKLRAVQSQRTHDGKLFQVDVLRYVDDHGREVTREVVRHPGAVVIVPVLEIDGDESFVMIRNQRIAVDEDLLELPAGKLEPVERMSPQRAAARELEEETGYTCSNLVRLGEFYTSPGFANELMHAYVARGLRKSKQRLEPGEDIRVEVIRRAIAMGMIDSGGIRDGKTIAAILMWDRRRHGGQDRHR